MSATIAAAVLGFLAGAVFFEIADWIIVSSTPHDLNDID